MIYSYKKYLFYWPFFLESTRHKLYFKSEIKFDLESRKFWAIIVRSLYLTTVKIKRSWNDAISCKRDIIKQARHKTRNEVIGNTSQIARRVIARYSMTGLSRNDVITRVTFLHYTLM